MNHQYDVLIIGSGLAGLTVALHLARLSERERELYSLLGREALALARERGIASDAAARLEALLSERGAA